MIYDYQVIPAPTRGLKAKGVKTTEARFAYALQDVMNRMAAEGWEFQRAETLPSVERAGLTGTTTVFRNLLVFRRPVAGQVTPVPAAPQASAPAPVLPPILQPDASPDAPPDAPPPIPDSPPTGDPMLPPTTASAPGTPRA